MAEALGNNESIFLSKLHVFRLSIEQGDTESADRLWREIDVMGRDWTKARYRPGDAEVYRAVDLFYRGELADEVLGHAETLAKGARNRIMIQELQTLRGEWHLDRNEPKRAIESLMQTVRMAREVGREDAHSEALLALAHLRAGERFDIRDEVERLSKTEGKASVTVAELWHALGERDRAVEHALRAHRWAVADGEPYVHRHYLNRTRKLLTDLCAPLPEVPRYDRSKVTPYPWENDVRVFIDKLRAERDAEKPKRKGRKTKRRRDEGTGE